MGFLQTLATKIAPIYPFAKRALFRFHGGVFPAYNKSLSTRNPIHTPLIPKELILPLAQTIGEKAVPVVKIGERVLKNQLLAQADVDPSKKLMVPIHAPTSGIIAAIEPRTLPHVSGLQDDCIILEPDNLDEAIDNVLQVDGTWPQDPETLKQLLSYSGIIGMGGAGFPTYAKLANQKGKIQKLLINGAECEPFITCDDLLMQTQAKSIWLGAQITAQALGCSEIHCGIETNKPKAIALMQQALDKVQKETGSIPMKIHQVATVYPMGGQKQLVYEMTGVELKSGGHAVDQGMLMMNVATLTAIHQAVTYGKPLTSRLITVSGSGLADGFNFDAMIGTPFNELAEVAQPKTPIDYPLIMGGPMMGVQMPNNHVPVLKTTNCVLANPPEPREMQMPCIRCGECMDACPVNLLPQQMYWHAQGHEYEKVEKLNVKDCIECGCCSYVCPSHIPLVQYYRHAKSEIRVLNAEKQAVELAKERHEFKLARIEREKAEREARLKAKKAAVKKQATDSKPTATKKPAAAAAARAAAAKAAAAKKAAGAATDKPLSAREKAIQAAQKAAANKQGQTDNDKKTKGQSLGTSKDKEVQADAAKKRAAMAAAKAKAAAAARKKSTDSASESEPTDKPISARDKAIAAAKAAAAKKAATKKVESTPTENHVEKTEDKPLTAREKAMAAAKAAAAKRAANKNKGNSKESENQLLEEEVKDKTSAQQTTDLSANSAESSPALEKEQARRAAMEKAKQAALARKKARLEPQQPANPAQETNAEESHVEDAKAKAKQAAMAAAKRAAAKRAAQKQTPDSDKPAGDS